MKSYVIRDIPDDLWIEVKVLAARRGVSIRELILELLEKETKKSDD